MRKTPFLVLLAAPLMLGGCAAGLGGTGDPLGGLLGGLLGGNNNSGYNNGDSFQRAAVDACGRQASQYGQVSIGNVQQADRNTLRVTGEVSSSNYQRRSFSCDFRSDGQIVSFRVG